MPGQGERAIKSTLLRVNPLPLHKPRGWTTKSRKLGIHFPGTTKYRAAGGATLLAAPSSRCKLTLGWVSCSEPVATAKFPGLKPATRLSWNLLLILEQQSTRSRGCRRCPRILVGFYYTVQCPSDSQLFPSRRNGSSRFTGSASTSTRAASNTQNPMCKIQGKGKAQKYVAFWVKILRGPRCPIMPDTNFSREVEVSRQQWIEGGFMALFTSPVSLLCAHASRIFLPEGGRRDTSLKACAAFETLLGTWDGAWRRQLQWPHGQARGVADGSVSREDERGTSISQQTSGVVQRSADRA